MAREELRKVFSIKWGVGCITIDLVTFYFLKEIEIGIFMVHVVYQWEVYVDRIPYHEDRLLYLE